MLEVNKYKEELILLVKENFIGNGNVETEKSVKDKKFTQHWTE